MTHLLSRLGLERREQRAWALYDVANSAWMTTIMTAVFPLFFVALATTAGLTEAAAGSRFAFARALSVILVGLTGPVMGAIADLRASKKRFLAAFIAIGVASAAALYFATSERWATALAIFVIGNVAVTSSLAFYNALLPAVAQPRRDRPRLDGRLRARLPGRRPAARRQPGDDRRRRSASGSRTADTAVRLSFVSVAVWWALFSLPLLRRVKEPAARVEPGEDAPRGLLRVALGRLRETFRELRHHKDAGLLLLAFLVYNDAVNTIINMGLIYGDEIGIPQASLMTTLVVIQLVGVPFAFAFGMLADRIGAKRAILIALAVYAGISVYAFALRTATQFLVMGILVGTVQGARAGARALALRQHDPAAQGGRDVRLLRAVRPLRRRDRHDDLRRDARDARHQPARDPEPDRVLRDRRLAADARRRRARAPPRTRGRRHDHRRGGAPEAGGRLAGSRGSARGRDAPA